MPHRALIALGSNLGDRAANLRAALDALSQPPCVLQGASRFHEFPAVPVGGHEPGGPYLNAACVVETALEPVELLDHLHAIEARLGRDRARMPHGAPRVIDLDLLLFGQRALRTPTLTLPHPAMHQRAFVLRPAAEVAGDWPVPTLAQSVESLWRRVEFAP